jgi:Alpha galactosidase A/Alpha galactosidase C-terminal beta sandwich domain/Fibronectin type III domain
MRHPGRTALRLLGAAVAAGVLSATVAAPAPAAVPTPTQVTKKAVSVTKPYLGWSSWSLESTNFPGVNPTGPASFLNEANVIKQTDVVASTLKSHGYQYINVDAGWMGGFDNFARPLANATTFPDGMKFLGNYIHGKGLKFGAYLAVGLDLRAYNNGNTPIFGANNCFTRDLVFADLRTTNGWNSSYKMDFAKPCAQAYVNSIANELASWGVDFLKLDGVGPGSFQGGANYDNTADVAAWNTALTQTGRPIQFVISWSLSHRQDAVWKANTNGWRVDTDVECYCSTIVTWNNSVKARFNDVVQWIPDSGSGHFNNLDSLDVGVGSMDGVTDTERQTYMTLWAIEAAPLYAGDDLTKLDSYGLSLLTNDEVIAVDQAGIAARPVSQATNQQAWYARNADGSYTVALFNLGADQANVTAAFADLGISGTADVRDLWSHQDLGNATGSVQSSLAGHGSRLFRITPASSASPNPPTTPRVLSAAGNSVSLAWDPSFSGGKGVASYQVNANGSTVLVTSGTSATVTGLAPSTDYQFTVVGVAKNGQKSPPSKAFAFTTPGSSGPTAYEAEASTSVLTGGAQIAGCSGCSGGQKIGDIGGSGVLTYPNISVARTGTYLMTVAYVDGDSSRDAIMTVNGSPIQLPTWGSNDNDWNSAQSVTIPVLLNAGTNSVSFGNATDFVADIDKITV